MATQTLSLGVYYGGQVTMGIQYDSVTLKASAVAVNTTAAGFTPTVTVTISGVVHTFQHTLGLGLQLFSLPNNALTLVLDTDGTPALPATIAISVQT